MKDEYFARYGLPRDFVLFVGALNKRKNFINILKAMTLPENADKHLVAISNGGDDYQHAENFIYEHGLKGAFSF